MKTKNRTNEQTNDNHEKDGKVVETTSSVVSTKPVATVVGTDGNQDAVRDGAKAKQDPVAVEEMERLNLADQDDSKPTCSKSDEKSTESETNKLCAENVLSEQQFILAKSNAVDQDTSVISNVVDTSNLSQSVNPPSVASFSLNQSVISSSTTNRTNTTNATSMLRNVNSSLLIGDSFNASSLGVVNSGVDLSLDSVVPYGDNE